MARSLTIKHEEHARTSPLFTGFLLLAVGWLLFGAMVGGASVEMDPGPSAPSAPADPGAALLR